MGEYKFVSRGEIAEKHAARLREVGIAGACQVILDAICEGIRNEELRLADPNKRAVVRPDEDGKPDDIVVNCDCIHLERMDDHYWWMGVYRGTQCLHLHIGTVGQKGESVEVRVVEDELGCVDDTKR